MLKSPQVASSCMVFYLLIIYFGKTDAGSVKPVLNFKCDGNKIKSIETDHLEKVYIILDETAQVYCNPNSNNLTNCFGSTKMNVSELKVLYEEGLTNPHIIGGKKVHYFHLVCKDAAHIQNATASFSKVTYKGNYTENVKNIAVEGSLTLNISQTPDSIQEIHNAEVGQYLYLFLKGPAKHVINPEECTAKPTNIPGAKPEQLWKRNVFCNDSNPDLIDQKWINITDKLYIGMYAFRFDSSDEVTITCTAFVCPESDGSQNCTQVCVNAKQSNTLRRRRNAIVGSKLQHAEKSASASFRIVKRDTSNAAAGLSMTSVVVLLLLIPVTSWV